MTDRAATVVTGAVDDADLVRSSWARLGGRTDVAADVIARHREHHRHYHTVEHVAAVLRHVDQLLGKLVHELPPETPIDTESLVAAAIFHDAVYEPSSTDNEARSAELAVRACRELRWATERLDVVRRLVLATAGHTADGADSAGAGRTSVNPGDHALRAEALARSVLLDADLAILGADPAGYARYVDQVRDEFAHVDDATWRRGRSQVLRSFLDRPFIYATAPMAARREAAARRNLAGELAGLAVGSDPEPSGPRIE